MTVKRTRMGAVVVRKRMAEEEVARSFVTAVMDMGLAAEYEGQEINWSTLRVDTGKDIGNDSIMELRMIRLTAEVKDD